MNKYLVKIAELEKASGNRLVRYISENRGDFPLSRLLSLSEKGVLKTPEQLLPGRNLGVKNQFEEISKRHGLIPEEGKSSSFIPVPAKSVAERRVDPNGNYRSNVGTRLPGNGFMASGGTRYAEVVVPPSYSPIKGNHQENIRRLHDTHMANHESFEVDEGLRMMGEGRFGNIRSPIGDIHPSPDFRTESHWNPAVLLRESRDMSHNPYAHVVPPVSRMIDFKRFQNAVKKRGGDLATEMTTQRMMPVDVSSNIPLYRQTQSREADLVRTLQGGRPYQSNPTSSEIRKARSMKHEDSQAILDSARDVGRFQKVKDLAQLSNDQLRGNWAFRN